MDPQGLIPKHAIDKLRCSSCGNHLSHFPVLVSTKNESFCSRCTFPEGEVAYRNLPFEVLIQDLKFPCRYKNQSCDEMLHPREVPQHEKDCPFRVIKCQVKQACHWDGSRGDLLQHCKNEHADLFLQSEFEINLGESNETENLIEHDNLLFIFTRKYDHDLRMLRFIVSTNRFEIEVRRFASQLRVKSGDKNLSIDFKTTAFGENFFTELSLDSLKTESRNQSATLELTIGGQIKDPKTDLKLDILSVLKCFVCSEYSVPPIHHCLRNSETLCLDCKPIHQSSCDPCLRNSASTRNINLDKMADLLNYPCKFHKNGCRFVSKPGSIKQHQKVCDLGDFECPINEFKTCGWRGLWKDLEAHIQNNHQELISNSAQISKQLLPQHMKCDIIKFADRLFRLVCLRASDDKYMWSVQLVGPFKDDYKFEIEIVDPTDKGRRLLVRRECGPFTRRDQIFKTGDSFFYFFCNQISSFVVDQVITFKVQIFR